MIRIIIPLVAALLALPAAASIIEGRVVGVADGDTLTVLDAGNRQHKIRLAEIDAPESKMDFGQVAKRQLSSLCYGKHAVVDVRDTDRYGRSVGQITCAGIDANAAMVETGLAWVYRKYATTPRLYALEAQARASQRGLWAQSNPTPPWEWRRAR